MPTCRVLPLCDFWRREAPPPLPLKQGRPRRQTRPGARAAAGAYQRPLGGSGLRGGGSAKHLPDVSAATRSPGSDRGPRPAGSREPSCQENKTKTQRASHLGRERRGARAGCVGPGAGPSLPALWPWGGHSHLLAAFWGGNLSFSGSGGSPEAWAEPAPVHFSPGTRGGRCRTPAPAHTREAGGLATWHWFAGAPLPALLGQAGSPAPGGRGRDAVTSILPLDSPSRTSRGSALQSQVLSWCTGPSILLLGGAGRSARGLG